MQSALRELQGFATSGRVWAVFAVVVALFVVTGPFGTAERLAPVPRFGYWLVLNAVAWSCALTFSVVANAGLDGRIASPLARYLAGSIVAAPLIALAIEWLNVLTFRQPLTLDTYLDRLAVTLPLSALCCLLTWLSAVSHAPAAPVGETLSTTPAEDQAEVPLLRRLPSAKRAPLLHLAVQDHYVEIVTMAGRELLLLRFADALDELGPAKGLRVHRSHWIADEAVEGLERDGGRLVLRLSTGARVPVSRPYLAEARSRWDHLR